MQIPISGNGSAKRTSRGYPTKDMLPSRKTKAAKFLLPLINDLDSGHTNIKINM